MHWTVPCTKTSGALRTQFLQWAIPKTIREKLGIEDGDRCSISVSHIQYSESLTLQVTSGGEIRVPARVSEILRLQANESPGSSVTFAIRIEDESQAASNNFEKEVAASLQLSAEARRARLEKAPRTPASRRVETVIFDRNPDVVAEVLYRAAGHCERCRIQAPFLRRSDGTPYLEVHHKTQLAHDGKDSVENAEALCPNCHRRAHYGQLA